MLAAVAHELSTHGYAKLSVTSLARSAAITRPAYYKMFADLQACALEAYELAAQKLLAAVRSALSDAEPAAADHATLAAIATFAQNTPAEFLLATRDAVGASPDLTSARLELLATLADLIEQRWAQSPADSAIPDLPALVVIGAVIRYLGMSMRRGPIDWERETAALGEWIDVYRVPSRDRRWGGLKPALPAAGARRQSGANAIPPPRTLPHGRRRPHPAAISSIERERIVHATAAIVRRYGYSEATVTEIASLAGVSREAFYRHFESKAAALDAAVTLVFEQAMAAMAGAYFTVGSQWPERIWKSTEALTEVLSSAPDFTHIGFIDAFAPDPASARRADEFFLGFNIFLSQGADLAQARRVPRAAPLAITAATIEIGVASAAAGLTDTLPSLVPLGVLLTIAPYTGIEPAREFVENRREGQKA